MDTVPVFDHRRYVCHRGGVGCDGVAVVGALVFAAALLRSFAERRRGDLSGGSRRRSVVWRGRVIEIQETRLSFAERVRRAVQRWRK